MTSRADYYVKPYRVRNVDEEGRCELRCCTGHFELGDTAWAVFYAQDDWPTEAGYCSRTCAVHAADLFAESRDESDRIGAAS